MVVAYRRSEARSGPSVDGVMARPAELAMASATWATVCWSVWMCWANSGVRSCWRCSLRCSTAQTPRLELRSEAASAQPPPHGRWLG